MTDRDAARCRERRALLGDFAALRKELGYGDHLGALQRYRGEAEFKRSDEPRPLQMSSFLIDSTIERIIDCAELEPQMLLATETP